MDEKKLHKLCNWISHGTLQQFFTEVSPKLLAQGYETDLVGEKLTCYSVEKQGGFLGIGVRKVRKPVLEVMREGDEVTINEETLDSQFVEIVLGLLHTH